MCGNKSVLYNSNCILVGRKYLNLFNIPIVLLHLLAVMSIWSVQFKFLDLLNWLVVYFKLNGN